MVKWVPHWGLEVPHWGWEVPHWGLEVPHWGLEVPRWGLEVPHWGWGCLTGLVCCFLSVQEMEVVGELFGVVIHNASETEKPTLTRVSAVISVTCTLPCSDKPALCIENTKTLICI